MLEPTIVLGTTTYKRDASRESGWAAQVMGPHGKLVWRGVQHSAHRKLKELEAKAAELKI